MPEKLIYQTPRPTRERQSPFERRSNGKALVRITPRKHEILIWLSQLKYLYTDQVARFFYKAGSRKLAQRELRRLYDGGYINRFPIPLTRKWGTPPLRYGATRTLHYLDAKGKTYTREFTDIPKRRQSYSPQSPHQFGNVEHQLAVNDYLLTTYTAVTNQGYYFELLSEWYRDLPIRPDAIYRMRSPMANTMTHYMVEIDRGTESVLKIKEKVKAYLRMYALEQYQHHFKTPCCHVIFVVVDCRMLPTRFLMNEAEWRKQIVRRRRMLKQWISETASAEQHIYVLSLHNLSFCRP